MIPGIDVSHWQYDIDWSEVKRSGVQFAFIKATEFPDKKTELFIDNKLEDNKRGASENGIYWGAYHFFRTHIDPLTQAQAFCETVGEFSSLPPVIDLEAAGSKGERLNHKVQQFLHEVERISGRLPVLYTSGGFWRSYMTYEKRSHTDWARKYPLWIAHYTLQWPAPLYPWAGWEFWQYSDSGKLPGIKTDVDLNWFNGSIQDLIQKFGQGFAQAAPQAASYNIEEIPVSNPKSGNRFFSEGKETADLNAQNEDFYPKYSPRQENFVRSYFMNN
jgi:lysozyme